MLFRFGPYRQMDAGAALRCLSPPWALANDLSSLPMFPACQALGSRWVLPGERLGSWVGGAQRGRDKPDTGQCLQGHVVSAVAEGSWELFPGEFCCPLTRRRLARSPCRAEMGEGGGKECGWSQGRPAGGEGVASLPQQVGTA